jgi:hypothetical protein
VYHSLFLKNDGTVSSCGERSSTGNGQPGTGIDSFAVKIDTLSGVTAISTGAYHSLFIKNDGTVVTNYGLDKNQANDTNR